MPDEERGFWLPRQALQELVAKASTQGPRGPRHNPQMTPGNAPADGGTYGVGPSLLGGGQVMPQSVRDALAAEGMDQNVPLGPGRPIPPAFGYGAPPRVFDYPSGVNVAQRPRSSMAAVSFDTLRSIIDAYDVARLCIRRRKADIRKLDWSIVPAKGVYDDVTDLIPKAERFFERPDGETPFDAWQDALLDDVLRYDAPTLYRWRNRAGKITLADDGTGFFNVDGTCYSADTEVLTETGWKRFADVDIKTDRFATRNQKTKTFEWQLATYKHDVAYVGEMIHFTSRTLDLLVTPNHRMLVSSLPRRLGGTGRGRVAGESFVTASALASEVERRRGANSGACRIPAVSDWDADDLMEFVLPPTPRGPGFRFSGDDFAAFMGMWLAEGCITDTRLHHVCISQQQTSKGFEPFRTLLTRLLGREPNRQQNAYWRFGSKALFDYLRPLGKATEKYVPAEVKNLSRRQLAIFWEFYRLGDGHTERSGRQTMVTSSRRMADDLQEIAQKLGFSASVRRRAVGHSVLAGRVINETAPSWCVRLRTTRSQSFRVQRASYRDRVYCVSVPNEVLYVRRNGQPAWCGNTIACLVDEYGRRPHPVQDPDSGEWLTPPAFVEWIKGFPGMWFTVDDLIYNPYNKVTSSPYGVPPIEDVLLAVNTDVRLQWAFLQFFTEGSIPRQFMQAPPDISNPNQLKMWQDYWDGLLRGDQTILHQIIWIPAGAQPKDAKELKWDTDFAEFLLTKTCAAFGMTPQAIGYTMKVNRATSETQRKEEEDSTTEPTVRFLEGIYDRILQEDLGLPLHFAFALQLDREDKLTEAQAANFDIRNGVLSPDERRLMLGLPVDTSDPVPRMVFFANGAVPLSSLNITADPATGTKAATPEQAAQLLGGPAPIDGAPITGKPAKPDFDAESEVPAAELVDLPRGRIPGAGPMPKGADSTMGPVGKDGLDGLIPAVSNARGPGLYPDEARRPKKAKRKKLAKGGPIAAGLAVVAADTGRVLMLQRSMSDPDDPAGGTWELPGGCLEAGEAPFEAAVREWSEETGATLPPGAAQGTWTSPDGVYQGFVWLIPHETDLPINADHEDRHVLNPDDPDGDGIEVVAWWDPNHLPALPALRPAARSTDWSVLRAATGPDPRAVAVKAIGSVDADVRAELRRWRTVSLNRVRAGRLPKLDFASDVLPDPLRAELAKALEEARTPSAVAETFASVL